MDERLARIELRRLLGRHPEIEVVGEAANAKEARRALLDLEPELLFLDVQMPGESGFDLLAWLVPLGIGVLGAAFVAVLAVAWSRRRAGDASEPELDPELERRLDAELRRFEQ